MDALSDDELMMRTRNGDSQAFAVIVDRYKHSLVNYLSHISASRDRGEEYAQEAFLRLYQSSSKYEDRGRLAPYLFRIATNLVRTDARRFRRWQILTPFFGSNGHHTETPHAELAREETRKVVGRALEKLPMLYRAPLALHEIEGWSYAQIALTLGCREGTVKSRICRGRERMRTMLAPFWNGGVGHE